MENFNFANLLGIIIVINVAVVKDEIFLIKFFIYCCCCYYCCNCFSLLLLLLLFCAACYHSATKRIIIKSEKHFLFPLSVACCWSCWCRFLTLTKQFVELLIVRFPLLSNWYCNQQIAKINNVTTQTTSNEPYSK